MYWSEQCAVQRSALFWNFTQRIMVVVIDVTGQPIGFIFKEPIGTPETSVSNNHSTLRKIQKSADLLYAAAEVKMISSVEFVRASLVVGN